MLELSIFCRELCKLTPQINVSNMKSKLLVLLIALLGPLAIQAQSVPQNVLDQFAKDYPEASEVKWEKAKANFEVEFFSDGDEMEALYDAKAEVLEIERSLPMRALPDVVADAFEAKYAGLEAEECAIIEVGGLKYFELEYMENGEEKEVLFDESGKEMEVDSTEEDED